MSPSEPDAALKHPAFKYQSTLEKKKLFIKGTYLRSLGVSLYVFILNLFDVITGLALTTTKEDLEALFKKFGILKDVRLVTFRNGNV